MARFDALLRRKAGKARAGTLPGPLKSGIEALSGIAMDEVRVHTNSAIPAQSGAIATTEGTTIHLGPGGEAALPHEAWHVVQQAQGRVRPTMRLDGGVAVSDDAGLEREADVMGARATRRSVAAPMALRTMPSTPPGATVVQRKKKTWEELTLEQQRIITDNIDAVFEKLKKLKAYSSYTSEEALLTALKGGDLDTTMALNIAKTKEQTDKIKEPIETIESKGGFTQDKILTESLSGDTGRNIVAGPNGMFDLRYNREPPSLAVTVRMALPPGAAYTQAIRETEAFWNNNGNRMVIVGQRGERIPIRINIEIVNGVQEEEKQGGGRPGQEPDVHFRYNPRIVEFPTTSRERGELTAGPEQRGPTGQRTIFHEFGHALGLGEEYGKLKERTHIDKVKKIMEADAYNKLGIEKEEDMDTIMGLGRTLLPHHFVEILHAFCRLTGTELAYWKIMPESELGPLPQRELEGDARQSVVTDPNPSQNQRQMTGRPDQGIAVGDELTGTREQLAAQVGSSYLAMRLVQARPGQIFTAGGYVWACTALTGRTTPEGTPELIYTIRRIPDGSHLP